MQQLRAEIEKRVEWIKSVMAQGNANGVVFGASGGKDSILVGAMCRMASKNVTGLIMPCESSINFTTDKQHAILVNKQLDICTKVVDLTEIKRLMQKTLQPLSDCHNDMAYANMNPRLRMIALYNYAQRKNYLVAGTSNRSERIMGYFTKWGDGACDFNPIADLTVREVYSYLNFFDIPDFIINKPPSAGLFENQTDEKDLGISYEEIDSFLLENKATDKAKDIILKASNKTAHKRKGVMFFNENND